MALQLFVHIAVLPATMVFFSVSPSPKIAPAILSGLETLCRYGARGALSLERLSLREDGRLAYRMKRPAPDGATHLVLTPLQLVKKLAALVPPPRFNLTRFHGVFAPNSRLRKKVVPSPPPPTVAPCSKPDAPPAGPPPAPPEHTPSRYRLPWAELLRRSFAVDVLSCNRCGSKRRVLAFLSHLPTTRRILEHLLLPCGPPPLPFDASPPQLTFEPLESA